MSEPPAEPDPYPWLPSATVLAWLKIDAGNPAAVAAVETARLAAADWCQGQRPDLWTVAGDVQPAEFVAAPRVVQAGVLAAARLYHRRSSPVGIVSADELGAASVLGTDPDVRRLLGRNRRPAVG